MEDALLHEIFGVSKSYCSTGTAIKDGGVYVAVEPRAKLFVCPDCRSRDVIRKGKRLRQVQTLPIGFHAVHLQVTVPRCQCKVCHHLFEIAPPFALPSRITPNR
jgi:transposase